MLLDLYSGAGGAAMGYIRAGFEVVGVDLRPQPHYPGSFIEGDALEVLHELLRLEVPIAAIHASPPCQRFSTITLMHPGAAEAHPDLVAATRAALVASGLPYVIENVPRAPLHNPVTLCGTMFGLGASGMELRRHRAIESNVAIWPPASCHHRLPAVGVYGNPGGSSKRDRRRFGSAADWREAMGVDWMSSAELAEAIPPAYTEHIGRALMEAL
jgi:DNA (cytosine-5)-methyltransferase 1